MAKGNGKNYMVWVESATAGTYTLIKGQKTCKRSGGRDKQENSTKDTLGNKTYQMGLNDLSWSMGCNPDLPDANGFTRLETLCLASPAAPFNIQIRKGGVTGGVSDVIWAGSVYGSMTDGSFDDNSPVEYSFEFVPAATSTTDALAI